jgi:hypothetical protein
MKNVALFLANDYVPIFETYWYFYKKIVWIVVLEITLDFYSYLENRKWTVI